MWEKIPIPCPSQVSTYCPYFSLGLGLTLITSGAIIRSQVTLQGGTAVSFAALNSPGSSQRSDIASDLPPPAWLLGGPVALPSWAPVLAYKVSPMSVRGARPEHPTTPKITWLSLTARRAPSPAISSDHWFQSFTRLQDRRPTPQLPAVVTVLPRQPTFHLGHSL